MLGVGNILLEASITALLKFLDIEVTDSVPDIAIDMKGAIMDTVMIELGNVTE